MTAPSWAAMMDALADVEALPAASGLLEFGRPPIGGIFADRGRVCWAAATGLQRRLRDLLVAHGSISSAELDQVYRRCRADGRQLGETLVAERRIEAVELERALRRHSAESLIALCVAPQPRRWAARPASYDPRFSFRPLDILLDAAAMSAPVGAGEAHRELVAFAGPGQRGAAFTLGSLAEPLVPVAVVGDGFTVASLRTLGAWARSVPTASHELGATPRFTLAATAAGDAITVWWRRGLLCCVVCEDRAQLASVAARHLAAA